MTRSSVLLVHGAFHGSWCWDRVATILRDAGTRVTVVDLPGDERGAGRADLVGKAAHLRDVLSTLDEPTVVCGHSFGGAVISEAVPADGPVTRLVYLTAYQLDAGEAVRIVDSPRNPLDFTGTDERLMPTRPWSDAAFDGLTAEDAAWALPRLTPEPMAMFTTPLTRAAWHDVPSSYVVCTADPAITPDVQRDLAVRSQTVYEIDAGHSAMLSHPAEVAAILLAETLRVDAS